MKEQLVELLSSFYQATGGREYNPCPEVAVAQVFKADEKLRNRLVT